MIFQLRFYHLLKKSPCSITNEKLKSFFFSVFNDMFSNLKISLMKNYIPKKFFPQLKFLGLDF